MCDGNPSLARQSVSPLGEKTQRSTSTTSRAKSQEKTEHSPDDKPASQLARSSTIYKMHQRPTETPRPPEPEQNHII